MTATGRSAATSLEHVPAPGSMLTHNAARSLAVVSRQRAKRLHSAACKLKLLELAISRKNNRAAIRREEMRIADTLSARQLLRRERTKRAQPETGLSVAQRGKNELAAIR